MLVGRFMKNLLSSMVMSPRVARASILNQSREERAMVENTV